MTCPVSSGTAMTTKVYSVNIKDIYVLQCHLLCIVNKMDAFILFEITIIHFKLTLNRWKNQEY